MNLNKLSITLCFAFQEHEGPFYVCITHRAGKLFNQINKAEIKYLSDNEGISSIELILPRRERRWIKRYGSHDRRKNI